MVPAFALKESAPVRLSAASTTCAAFLWMWMRGLSDAGALGAFAVEHVELAFDVAEDQIGSRGARAAGPVRARHIGQAKPDSAPTTSEVKQRDQCVVLKSHS